MDASNTDKKIPRGRCRKEMTKEERVQQFIESYDKKIEKQKEYYDKVASKEETCECGRTVVSKYMERHLQTDLHKRRIEKKTHTWSN